MKPAQYQLITMDLTLDEWFLINTQFSNFSIALVVYAARNEIDEP